MNQLVDGWDDEKVREFQETFLTWYDEEKRWLPWRVSKEPYGIWVSEIMLQQTQVATVIPYYERFMEWFPTVADLAAAPEERLLKAWEGLGYYSRVRNMQFAARQIMDEFGGNFPQTVKELKKLKGIGPYTAGAIASISFDAPEPAVDGNVMRVFSRLFGIKQDIAKSGTLKFFDFVVRHVISHDAPGDMNQATMDLGASLCTPTSPQCSSCPLKNYCLANREGTQENYPVKSKKIKVKPMYYIGLAKENAQGAFEFVQRAGTGLLANMWTFPLIEVTKKEYEIFRQEWQRYLNEPRGQETLDLVAEEDWRLSDWLDAQDSETVWKKMPVGEVTHVFSHLKWHVLVVYGRRKLADITGKEISEVGQETHWLSVEDFESRPLPKPQEKMTHLLIQQGYFEKMISADK
ncbi:A/G-specific adenine glycosylase [Vagococcus elongatus]|uniref:Adenine DNA glycosylase n=1 Tax=Vagococcus elongatus TaxID=180344 RepID=A0A430B234_9ENTE|nr:A/G-specific adenine glycosylase [Vagococcus elongatus]RSU14397.1 A/G-specific adenine glycosylase [Vagococcus elongatus]